MLMRFLYKLAEIASYLPTNPLPPIVYPTQTLLSLACLVDEHDHTTKLWQ